MTAREQMALLLNELMGPSRNDDVDRSALNYKDPEVCKFFLVSFCPHELFVNTKADLGPCQFYHDENLRIAYRNSKDFERLGYERSFYRFLCKMHDDIMRKIQKNKERLALTQGNSSMDEASKARLTERISSLEKDVKLYLAEAESSGASGELERSQKFAKKAEETRIEIENVKKLLDTPAIPLPPQRFNDPNAPKPMEVCETCGCFLIIGDVQQRIDEHYSGKQHLGFAKVTATMKELKDRMKAIDDAEMSPERRRRSRSRHRDRSRYRSSSKKSSSSKSHRRDADDNRHGSSGHHSSGHHRSHHKRSRSRSITRGGSRHRHHHRSRSGSRRRH